MRTGRLSKGCALALDGVQNDCGRLSLGSVSFLNSVVDLLYIVAVFQLDSIPTERIELCSQALAVRHDVFNSTVELTLVAVYEANQVVQLVMSCELSSLPNLTFIALAVANEYEYMAVTAVQLVAQSSAGSGGHTLTQRTSRQINARSLVPGLFRVRVSSSG